MLLYHQCLLLCSFIPSAVHLLTFSTQAIGSCWRKSPIDQIKASLVSAGPQALLWEILLYLQCVWLHPVSSLSTLFKPQILPHFKERTSYFTEAAEAIIWKQLQLMAMGSKHVPATVFISLQMIVKKGDLLSILRSLHLLCSGSYLLSFSLCIPNFAPHKFKSFYPQNKTEQNRKSFLRFSFFTLAIILSVSTHLEQTSHHCCLFFIFTHSLTSYQTWLLSPSLCKPVPLTKLTNNLYVVTFSWQFFIWFYFSDAWHTSRHLILTLRKQSGLQWNCSHMVSF